MKMCDDDEILRVGFILFSLTRFHLPVVFVLKFFKESVQTTCSFPVGKIALRSAFLLIRHFKYSVILSKIHSYRLLFLSHWVTLYRSMLHRLLTISGISVIFSRQPSN